MEAPHTSHNSPEEEGDNCTNCGKCRCGGRRHAETAHDSGTVATPHKALSAEGAPQISAPAATL